MAGGNLDARSSNFLDLENDDESLGSNFVDARVEPASNNPYLNSSQEKFCFPDILGVVGGSDTPIIMSPKLS